MSKLMITSHAALAALLLAACSAAPPPAPAAPPAPPAAAAPALTLPISLNALMVGAVDHASDPLFAVGNAIEGIGKPPKTDDDWRNVEYHAYQMIAYGKLIQIPGTGPMDAEWTSKPEWKSYSEQLTGVGMDMLAKAQAKDARAFDELGNKLIDVCEGCHKVYKPDIPTMKILHKPDKPAKR